MGKLFKTMKERSERGLKRIVAKHLPKGIILIMMMTMNGGKGG